MSNVILPFAACGTLLENPIDFYNRLDSFRAGIQEIHLLGIYYYCTIVSSWPIDSAIPFILHSFVGHGPVFPRPLACRPNLAHPPMNILPVFSTGKQLIVCVCIGGWLDWFGYFRINAWSTMLPCVYPAILPIFLLFSILSIFGWKERNIPDRLAHTGRPSFTLVIAVNSICLNNHVLLV